mgnify:CR=1 FL=1
MARAAERGPAAVRFLREVFSGCKAVSTKPAAVIRKLINGGRAQQFTDAPQTLLKEGGFISLVRSFYDDVESGRSPVLIQSNLMTSIRSIHPAELREVFLDLLFGARATQNFVRRKPEDMTGPFTMRLLALATAGIIHFNPHRAKRWSTRRRRMKRKPKLVRSYIMICLFLDNMLI